MARSEAYGLLRSNEPDPFVIHAHVPVAVVRVAPRSWKQRRWSKRTIRIRAVSRVIAIETHLGIGKKIAA